MPTYDALHPGSSFEPEMYRHMLVPVDSTDLSIEVVASAVDFAASAGARVTFLHAVPERAAPSTGNAEELRNSSFPGSAHAPNLAFGLLAKVEAAARAWGVPCVSMEMTGEKPASAIIAAARSRGCDLIFMGSHDSGGKLGVPLASETIDVLKSVGLPVLVVPTGALQPPARAIVVIRDEHRALGAVLHAWTGMLGTLADAEAGLAPASMYAVLRYIERLESRHQTNESILFQQVRARTSTVDSELDELGRRHERSRALLEGLGQPLNAFEAATGELVRQRAIRSLQVAVADYASSLWEHVGREEAVVLPAARRFLTEADWAGIDAVIAGDGTVKSEQDGYRDVMACIAELAQSARG